MLRKLPLLIVALFGLHFATHAQKCGFDEAHAQLMAANPGYSQAVQQQKADWVQLLQNNANALIVNTSSGPVYEIPVVIHVIHTGGALPSTYNPSDAQLTNMINYLNATYAATWASYPSATTGGTAFPVRFALAKRTPNCAPTTGIVRVNGSTLTGYVQYGIDRSGSLGGPSDAAVKALSIWPNDRYYNVWVVNKIDGEDGISPTAPFVAGYAYFPGAPATIDGTVMLASQAVAGEITLPHEVGHAFGLYHTFEGDGTGATCPPNANCAVDGDEVCDTEPHKRSQFNCPSGTNPCTGLSYNNVTHNFMDYSSCQDRFTAGQRTKWLASLMSNNRASLLSSLGATALPQTPVTVATCTPTSSQPTNTSNAGPRRITISTTGVGATPVFSTTSSGYNGDGNLVYWDRTCVAQANLNAGTLYSISVGTGQNAENVRVYIDYNNDGAFGTGELVFTSNGTSSFQTHTGGFTVPTAGVVTCDTLRMRVVSDRTIAAAPTACGPLTYGQAEDYSVYITGPSNTASLTITANPTGATCVNSPITFTATPGGSPGTNYTINWYVNNVFTGATGTTYTNSTLANGNNVRARIVYTGPCGADSSTSNIITITRVNSITPSVTIAVTGGTNPGCAGQPLTFTATPVNGGTAPTFQWLINGAPVSGQTGNTFTTSSLNAGNTVSVQLTSSLTCANPATVTSNAITIAFNPLTATITITQTGGTNPICAGKPATFTATFTNGGTTPSITWLVNGFSTGVTGNIFTSSTLNNGDTIRALLFSNNPCVTSPTVLSNGIRLGVTPSDTPTVSIAITQGTNPGCKDSLLQLTATGGNTGATPVYAWFVNGVLSSNGPVYNATGLSTGDVVYVRMIASGPQCHYRDTAYSASIVMERYATPAPPTISYIGNMLVSDSPNVQWYGPSGLIPGAVGPFYIPTVPGIYYAVALNKGCNSVPGNRLTISPTSLGSYNLSEVKIYPNPNSGQVIIDWGNNPATVRISVHAPNGQGLKYETATHATKKVLDLSAFANGVYFIVIKDDQGKTGTVRVTLAR